MNRIHNNKRFDDNEIRSKLDLLAELQAHQAELEMQNRELRNTQLQLKETRDRFADLYDYAPVGYLTLDTAGDILTINLTGCAMLGMEYAFIIDKSFVNHIAESDNHVFFQSLQQTFKSSSNTVAELRIKNPLGKTKYVRLESSVVKDTNTCRTVMTDINQLKETMSHNRGLLHENRRLMQNLFKIQEDERRFLARELHDEYGQWLTAIHAEAESILNCTDKESAIHTSSQAINECVKEMYSVMRGMLHQLRPTLLDTLGLKDALLELKRNWCTHHADIVLEFKLEGELGALGENINITIYRIVQEALNNICSHANSTRAHVSLSCKTDEVSMAKFLLLSVEDNGKGYDTDHATNGFGLLGMRERAIAASGKFTICSAPNEGTKIRVRLPLDCSDKKRRTDDY